MGKIKAKIFGTKPENPTDDKNNSESNNNNHTAPPSSRQNIISRLFARTDI